MRALSFLLSAADRALSSRALFSVKTAWNRFFREPDAIQITLILLATGVGVSLFLWLRPVTPVPPKTIVRTRPMVSVEEMRGVINQAQQSRPRR